MSTSHRMVERRILEAVMLVVAGCQKQPDAHSFDSVLATATATSTTTVASPPEDLTVAGDPSPTQVPDAIAGAEQKPAELCAQYKDKVKVDTSRVKTMQVQEYAPEPQAQAYWDANRKLVMCTVIRARDEVEIEVTRYPTCCPMPGPPRPCPPPSKAKAPGVRMVVERVELDTDGKVASSKLELYGFEKNPQGRHACGRQPEGLVIDSRARAGSRVGAELARMAELEAASVPAFERLARELAAHGAPPSLVERARDAARDEVRHATLMKRLAEAHGALPAELRHAELGVRELLPIAIENAVEGCVREAYGALVASYQAERAAPELRDAFASVASDERAHAALSEHADSWLVSRLGECDRAQVATARALALADLRASLEHSQPCSTLGLPDRDTAVALFDAYFA